MTDTEGMTEHGGGVERMPPQRDARVNARMVRVLFYLPGFLALLLLKGSNSVTSASGSQGFGVTIELLMLSSVAAIVAGMLISAGGVGKRDQDAASRTGVWAGQVVMDVMAFVPLLMAVPPLFHSLTQIGLSGPPDDQSHYGLSELIPASAIVPWAVFELAGYSTLGYVLKRPIHVLFVVLVAAGTVGGYVSNRNGWYTTELIVDGVIVGVLAVISVVCILALKGRQARLDPPSG